LDEAGRPAERGLTPGVAEGRAAKAEAAETLRRLAQSHRAIEVR